MKKEMGSEVPQFLSTHPSPTNRIRQIRNWIPQIRSQFQKLKISNFFFFIFLKVSFKQLEQ